MDVADRSSRGIGSDRSPSSTAPRAACRSWMWPLHSGAACSPEA